jgi:carbon storage regulator
MLVLTRRLGEQVIIDGRILVKVTSINGNAVRLGVTAPREISVGREELLNQQEAPNPSLRRPRAHRSR